MGMENATPTKEMTMLTELRAIIEELGSMSDTFSDKDVTHIAKLISTAIMDLELAADHMDDVERDERDGEG